MVRTLSSAAKNRSSMSSPCRRIHGSCELEWPLQHLVSSVASRRNGIHVCKVHSSGDDTAAASCNIWGCFRPDAALHKGTSMYLPCKARAPDIMEVIHKFSADMQPSLMCNVLIKLGIDQKLQMVVFCSGSMTKLSMLKSSLCLTRLEAIMLCLTCTVLRQLEQVSK